MGMVQQDNNNEGGGGKATETCRSRCTPILRSRSKKMHEEECPLNSIGRQALTAMFKRSSVFPAPLVPNTSTICYHDNWRSHQF